MNDDLIWELERAEHNRIRRQWDLLSSLPLMPLPRLPDQDSEQRLFTLADLCLLAYGVCAAAIGHVEKSTFFFERKILPEIEQRSPELHACVLLWLAVLYLYRGNVEKTLEYVAAVRTAGLTEAVPEIQLIEGLAVRVAGDPWGAVDILRPLARKDSALFPIERHTALAALLEATVASGVRPATPQQILWLDRQDFHGRRGTIPMVLVALYRLIIQSGPPPGVRTADEILAALDRIPSYQRPLMTKLLEDVLPRPLAGVVRIGGKTHSAA